MKHGRHLTTLAVMNDNVEKYCSLLDRLKQRVLWTDGRGVTQRLDQMQTNHLRNLRMWLEERAGLLYAFSVTMDALNQLANIDPIYPGDRNPEFTRESPLTWLHFQPLVVEMNRLLEPVDRLANEPDEPWQPL